MSYSNGLNYLESKTKVLELSNEFGARVAVCPLWNGRVMTSTCNGLEGESFGLINVREIEANASDPSRGAGGENQFSLSPDGGPFSLFYNTESGVATLPDPEMEHGIVMPTAYGEGPFEVDFGMPMRSLRMRRSISATNISGARFDLNAVRLVRLLNETELHEIFPSEVLIALEQPEVSFVSYETTNTLVNSGMPFSRSSGLISVRIRNMFNASPYTVMAVPYRLGSEDELGPPIQSDFYGLSSRKRLHILPQVALMKADGEMRGQLGVSRHRALNRCVTIDFKTGVLSVVVFNLPERPASCDYMSNDYYETEDEQRGHDFLSTRMFYLRHFAQSESLEMPEPGPFSFDSSFQKMKLSRDSLLSLAKEFRENGPYSGEVVRAYNNGPLYKNKDKEKEKLTEKAVPFYELDTFSPAVELKKGESITHTQWTTHISADSRTIKYLLQKLLQVEYSEIFNTILSDV